MLVSCWSAKGGSGTTVVAAALAVMLADRARPARLVDCGGDLPAALGCPEPDTPGLADWLAAGAEVAPDALDRLAVAAAEGVEVVPRGDGALPVGDRLEVLAALLGASARPVVVDCGAVPPAHAGPSVGRRLASGGRSLLVTRPCYLSLRRALAVGVEPHGVVVVREPGRALGAAEVEDVLGVEVVACVTVEPSVARAVDAGLLATRLPRALRRLEHAL